MSHPLVECRCRICLRVAPDGISVGRYIQPREKRDHTTRELLRSRATQSPPPPSRPSSQLRRDIDVHSAAQQLFSHTLADSHQPRKPDIYLEHEIPEIYPPVSSLTSQFSALNLVGQSNSRAALAVQNEKRERDNRTQTAQSIVAKVAKEVAELHHSLDENPSPSSSAIVHIRTQLPLLQQSLEKVNRQTQSVQRPRSATLLELQRLHSRLQECDETSSRTSEPGAIVCNTDAHFDWPVDQLHPLAQASAFLGVASGVAMGASKTQSNFLMDMTTLIAHLAASDSAGHVDAERDARLQQIPSSISTASKLFNLDGGTTLYAVCLSCHCTYPPNPSTVSSAPVYPERCSNIPGPEAPECGTQLLDPNSPNVPIKSFRYHHFKDYLANLFSCPKLEKLMDDSSLDISRSLDDPPPQFVTDILEAEYVKKFMGPDSATRFFAEPDGCWPFIFSLNVDFFAPEGLSIHGGAISCGIISIVCPHLPIDIRYKPENMCLIGIIPGPKEPSLEELNHYIRPLVDEFLEFWDKGFHFTRTALHPEGKTCRGALVPYVCDAPAARKLHQMTAARSHWFCTRCKCYHLQNLGATDHDNWVLRDADELRRHAEAWKEATTAQKREELVKAHGIRYSELWQLPYYDPANQSVTDPMHAGLQGAVQHHCRTLLKLTAKEANTRREVVPAFEYEFKEPEGDGKEKADAIKIHKLLVLPAPQTDAGGIEKHRSELRKKLSAPTMKCLAAMCEELKCSPAKGTGKGSRVLKADFIEALLEWRSARQWTSMGPPKAVTTPGVLARIHEVIKNTATPSWVESVPHMFGHESAGTLKAAQWRALFTIFIPIALISVWGAGTSHSSLALASRLRSVLDHTMLLVSATSIVFARTMTTARVSAYRKYITSYVEQIKDLYPDQAYRPNHHHIQHIADFLQLFGPTSSWSCFPFERLIGLVQQLPHNHKIGEFESTLTTSFIRAARLRRWLSKPDRPEIVGTFKTLFEKVFSPPSLIQKPTVLIASSPKDVPDDLCHLIGRRRATLQARVHYDGATYSRSSTHLGNSLIRFRLAGSFIVVPACIKYIYHEEDSICFAVQRQVPLPDDYKDPYRLYPHFPAKVFSSTLADELEVVELERVVGHYARWEMAPGLSVVLALDRD